MLEKADYYEAARFEAELETLFARGFQFAGLTSELENNRDYVCVDHAGCAVVVQNFKGELRAFQNICSHRFNRIQTEERGNRPLMCSYHGWNFDAAGYPVGMPQRHGFDTESEGAREVLCLKPYRVETCGRFVFFTEEDYPTRLRDYLGGFFNALEEIGSHIGAEVHFGRLDHAANWKLLVENVLECYHCAVVHPQTFGEGLGVGKKPLEEVVVERGHSSCHFPRVEVKRENLRRRLLSHLDRREFTHASFYHIHIFPNLFISSTEGTSFYIGQALPLSPEETVLRIRFFEPAVELDEKQRRHQQSINDQSNALGMKVIEEDRAILENIQKSIRLSAKPGVLGADEVRIAAFFEHYQTASQSAALNQHLIDSQAIEHGT